MALEVFLSLVTIDTLVLNQYYVKEKLDLVKTGFFFFFKLSVI